MEELDIYNVGLRDMRQDSCEYEGTLDDRFFTDIDAGDIQKGHLNVRLSVKKTIGAYMLNFHIEGAVTVVCDRCLDELELLVNTDNALKVKLGSDFSEEEDFVTVPEEDGYIDVSWFIYEFVALSLPMKKVHAPGECNEQMMGVLNEHSCISSPAEELEDYEDMEEGTEAISDDDRESDPRWDELKKILNNN